MTKKINEQLKDRDELSLKVREERSPKDGGYELGISLTTSLFPRARLLDKRSPIVKCYEKLAFVVTRNASKSGNCF